MTFKNVTGFSLALLLTLSACQRHGGINWMNEGEAVNWGFDSGRSHQASEAVTPPLTLKWTQKSEGGFGRAMAVLGDCCLAGLQNGQLEIFNIQSGSRVRRKKQGYRTEITVAASGRSVFTFQRHLEPSIKCFDIQSGDVLWEARGGSVVGEPLLLDSTLAVVNQAGHLMLFHQKSGALLHERRLKGRFWSGPSGNGQQLLLGRHDGTVMAFDAATLNPQWQQRLPGRIAGSPVVNAEQVYAGSLDGSVTALNLADGNVLWQRSIAGAVFETPGLSADWLYVVTARGRVAALSRLDGQPKWSVEMGVPVGTSPVQSGGVIYLGLLDHRFLALSVDTGELLWEHKLKGRVRTTPLIAGGHVLVASEGRTLYAFASETP